MKTETTPAKTEFKFDCPKCGQHLVAAHTWVGLGITCPSCQSRINIPPPPGGEEFSCPPDLRLRTKTTIRIELPTKPAQHVAGPNGHPFGPHASEAFAPPSLTGREPWSELVKRLENGALAEPAMLATALFRELANVRHRLEAVERKLALDHPIDNSPPTQPAKVWEASGEVRR